MSTFLFMGCLVALACSAELKVPLPPGASVEVTNSAGSSTMNVTNMSDQQMPMPMPIQATILPEQSEGTNAQRPPPKDIDTMLGILEGDMKDPARAKVKIGRRVEIKVEQFLMNSNKSTSSPHDFAIALKFFVGGKPNLDDNGTMTKLDSFAKLDSAHIPAGFTQLFSGSYPAETNQWIPVNKIVVADVCKSLFEPTYLEVLIVPGTSNPEFPVGDFKCWAPLNYFPVATEAEATWNTFLECGSKMMETGVEYRLKMRSRQYVDKFNSALVECK